MVRDGALILDVGGESTRPGASPVPVDEELDRTIPVLEILRAEFDVLLSIDTSTPEVMSAALAAGAGLVNDVRALTRAGAMQVVAEAQAAPAVCLMHMQGQPVSMQETFSYDSVVDEVFSFLKQRIADTEQAGVERSRILSIRVLASVNPSSTIMSCCAVWLNSMSLARQFWWVSRENP